MKSGKAKNTKRIIKAGDFTGLAEEYSLNRPNYSATVLNSIIGLLNKPLRECDAADIGAGTGIWSRMLYNSGIKSLIAIEPNLDMLRVGIRDSKGTSIVWKNGSAEETGLADQSKDWLTMASSFHWANFNKAIKEFHNKLRTGGIFTAIWNPRLIEESPILIQIENKLHDLKPNMQRVSSGRSGITETLTQQLLNSGKFEDVIYIEGRHKIEMSKERYIGAWRSVNDLQNQLGKERFDQFLSFIDYKLKNVETIDATYLTRSWSARKTKNS